MELFLVRHGEAAASWGQAADPGLSELGQRQAEDAAGTLRREIAGDTELLSSPLARAVQTAGPLARMLEREVELEDVFREIPSPVPMETRQDWLRQFMREQWQEQGAELHAWREAAMERLLGLRSSAVVFTHFLVINAVVGKVLGRSETLCFWPDNGSITRLRHNGDGLELLALGQEMATVVN